eukprot:1160265-Pelagomonas_calceolata.AAC.5
MFVEMDIRIKELLPKMGLACFGAGCFLCTGLGQGGARLCLPRPGGKFRDLGTVAEHSWWQ